MTFIHAEVYADDTLKETAPAVQAYELDFEPLLFVADATGNLVARLDAVFDKSEMRDDRVAWPAAERQRRRAPRPDSDQPKLDPQPQVRLAFGFVIENPRLLQAVLVVERGADEHLRAGRIDDDANAACSTVWSSASTSPSKNISYEKPEQPPGRTATRSANSGWPSASSSSLTLTAAVSVTVITVRPSSTGACT